MRRTRGTRKPCQVGTTFALATGGDRARGCGGCKGRGGAAAGAYGRRMRCAATFRTNLGAEVHATWLHREAEQNLFTRDARAERCGQRTRGMRGCSCAERACAWSRRACAEACPQAGAHSPPEKSLLRNSLTEELSVGSNAGGRVIAQELPEQIAKLLVWKPAGSTRVTPTFYVIQARYCPLLLVLLVQCLWGAIHVNKLPRPSGHY